MLCQQVMIGPYHWSTETSTDNSGQLDNENNNGFFLDSELRKLVQNTMLSAGNQVFVFVTRRTLDHQ